MGFAALAEGGVFVGAEGVSGVIGTALQRDLHVVDGSDAAHHPGLAVVGLHLAQLLGAFRIDLKNSDGADGFGIGIGFRRTCADGVASTVS